MTGMAFVETWQALAGLRAVLGALEAGFFPACAYLVSCWYKRSEMQFRLACFYLVSTLAGGFSSILAYGLGRLHGKDGRAGWRWVFLVEGIITMGLAVVAYFCQFYYFLWIALVLIRFCSDCRFPRQEQILDCRANQARQATH